MARKQCQQCQSAQAVRPGGLCNRCYSVTTKPEPTVEIELQKIRVDGRTQTRAATCPETVQRYADAMEDGATFPPLVVFHDGEHYWLADGFHRREAMGRVMTMAAQCVVRAGTAADAAEYGAGANQRHGKPATYADQVAAVRTLLHHRPELAVRRIAEIIGVGWAKANRLTEEAKGQQLTGKGYSAEHAPATSERAKERTRSAPTPKPDATSADSDVSDDGDQDSPATLPVAVTLPEPTGHAAPAVDGIGLPLDTDESRRVFEVVPRVAELVKHLRAGQRMLNEICHMGHGTEGLQWRCRRRELKEGQESWDNDHLRLAIHELSHAVPHATVCPGCHSRGRERDPECPTCAGRPYVTLSQWEGFAEPLRAAVLALVGQQEAA